MIDWRGIDQMGKRLSLKGANNEGDWKGDFQLISTFLLKTMNKWQRLLVTKYNFIISISLQSDLLHLSYFKLWSVLDHQSVQIWNIKGLHDQFNKKLLI